MTSLPYVAPWQTGFERYSTQVISGVLTSAANVRWIIADGQWWRFLYLEATFSTDATAANRAAELRAKDPSGTTVMTIPAVTVQVASHNCAYIFGPGLGPYDNGAGGVSQGQAIPIPDMLWGPGYTLNIDSSSVGTDTFQAPMQAGVEIYTEIHPGVLAPAVIPVLL